MSQTYVVVVVEPDVLVRHPLAAYLRECGYQVLEALNADEARQIMIESPMPVTAVLVDIDAAPKDGFALATWIRAHDPDIDVLLAATPAKVAEQAGGLCEEGPRLAKPYDHQFILDRIRRGRAARDRNL
jgi:DNA-binding response OmpR family regulator